MAVRTNATDVKAILGHNYDSLRAPSLEPFMDSATVIVDRLDTAAASKDVTLTDDELELIERWLSAYFYCKRDPTYASKSTQGASGSYVTSQSLDGEGDRYKRAAMELDYSGCLNAILNRKVARARLLREDDPYDTIGDG